MGLLADLSQVFILLLCFVGVGLLTRLVRPEVPFGFHFCFAPFALIAFLFCLEHYFPLGQLPWLWIPWSLLTLFLIQSERPSFFKEPVLWYFLLGFGVCFFWRFSFPDIYGESEMLPDLNHLVSYSAGGRLPAEDSWMKGASDDTYYIFQYYAAGLIHRFMGCGPGLTYQLGYCTLVGVGIAAAGEGVRTAVRAFGAGRISESCKSIDGTGVSIGGRASSLSRRSGFQPELFSAGETPAGRDRPEACPPLLFERSPLIYFSFATFGDAPFMAGLLASLTLVLGGVGSCYLTPFMAQNFKPSTVDAMRFIGCYGMPATPEHKTQFGAWVVDVLGQSRVDAPMEYYSYIVMLGDFHPSLSSLAFLGLVILAIGTAETAVPGSFTDRCCVTGAIATPFFVMISNTWLMPLQAILVGCWLGYRWLRGRRDSWMLLLGSGLGSLILIFPFFMHFAYQTRYYPIHIEWVQVRPPFLNWIVVMAPAIFLWLLSLGGACKKRMFAGFTAVVGLGALVGTYLFYVHDVYGGNEAIFNTTLKWWPWVYALVLMLGLIAAWPHRLLRWGAIFILSSTILFNSYIFLQQWRVLPKNHAGQLDGYAWFKENPQHRDIYLELQGLPKGVVLESLDSTAPDSGCSLSLFTGHSSVGGWTGHELLWRGGRTDIEWLQKYREQFYEGTLENPASWLRSIVPGGVDYVVWLNRDNDRSLKVWPILNEQLKNDYDWRPTYQHAEGHWGIWIKRR